MASLLGDTLVTRSGEERPTADVLGGGTTKYVAVYISASWCPPCRTFTPVLAAWYSAHAARLGLRIVFASCDHDEPSFRAYFAKMPWDLAVPFASKDVVAKLSGKFGRSIPRLVLLDAATGGVVRADIRSAVMDDEEAEDFPYVQSAAAAAKGDSGLGAAGGRAVAVRTALLGVGMLLAVAVESWPVRAAIVAFFGFVLPSLRGL